MKRYLKNTAKIGCLLAVGLISGCGMQQSAVKNANKTEMNPLLGEWKPPMRQKPLQKLPEDFMIRM